MFNDNVEMFSVEELPPLEITHHRSSDEARHHFGEMFDSFNGVDGRLVGTLLHHNELANTVTHCAFQALFRHGECNTTIMQQQIPFILQVEAITAMDLLIDRIMGLSIDVTDHSVQTVSLGYDNQRETMFDIRTRDLS